MLLVLQRHPWIRSLLLRRNFEWTRWTTIRSQSTSIRYDSPKTEPESLWLIQDELPWDDGPPAFIAEFNLIWRRRMIPKDWHRYLTTYEHFVRESNLNSRSLRGQLLVDDPSYQTDIELWLDLFYFRRSHGIVETLILWDALKNRRILERSTNTAEIWAELLQLGLARPEILYEIFVLARTVYEKRGEKYSGWYRQVVGHFMKTDPVKGYYWHKRIKAIFPPSRTDILELMPLFLEGLGNNQTELYIERIYLDLPFRDLYAEIILFLCRADRHSMALQWHHFLMRNGDFPPDCKCTRPLAWYLMATGREEDAQRFVKELDDHKGSFAVKVPAKLEEQRPISREIMDRIHGEFYGIAPKTLSDEFCARLFATSFFSVDTIIKGLYMLGIDKIGPLALREIALRAIDGGVCNTEVIKKNIEGLEEARISIGKSVFSRLIMKLALERNSEMLADVVTCDMHYEAFEDRQLQESLLASYLQDNKQRHINYTLAILSINTPEVLRDTTEYNLLFRAYCMRGDWTKASQTTKRMAERSITLTGTSCRYLLDVGLPERGIGKRLSADDSLYRVTRMCQEALVSGSYVPAFVWSELLVRLGIAGQLEKFENLALWLATRHLNAKDVVKETSQNGRALLSSEGSSTGSMRITSLQLCRDFKEIFCDEMVRGVIAWGFQHSVTKEPMYIHLTDDAPNLESSIELPALRGLRLLLKLRNEYGVKIKDSTVAKACVIRLTVVLGIGRSNRRINRQAQQRHAPSDYDDYFFAIESLWKKPIIQIYSEQYALSHRSPGLTNLQELEMRILRGYSSSALRYQKRSKLRSNYRDPDTHQKIHVRN
ncbi:MAG: hypothetical protein MMC33_005338 [Icmadophila ericetorum]|nr:hypothetical protein [Icmadophila ericetorum]